MTDEDGPLLKPCPFCGSDDLYFNMVNHCRVKHLADEIRCASCDAAGGERYTPDEAIEAWNMRVKGKPE
jgi:Lar family restriction alleviation protein